MVSVANISDEAGKAMADVMGKSLRWAILKPVESDIVLVSTGPRDSDIASVAAALSDEPCYVIYDFEATRSDGSGLCKTCFVTYAPDSCTSMQAKFALQNYKGSVKARVNSAKEI